MSLSDGDAKACEITYAELICKKMVCFGCGDTHFLNLWIMHNRRDEQRSYNRFS